MTGVERPYAAIHETHIGVVVLVGERAYKVKKPVDFGFVDFTSPEARRVACQREVELNRRLTHDVYLGVSTLSSVDSSEVAEYVVVMRRMPESRRLATLVRAGEDVRAVIDELGRTIAAFHATAARSADIACEGSRDAILRRWCDGFRQVRSLGVLNDAVLTDIEQLARAFLAGRGDLFHRRIEQGRVVDGHGDLLAQDIFCLAEGPKVLDCLEFDDRLRWLDGLDDVAFLAMDLERLGAPDLARRLRDRYVEFSGDPAPDVLWHHYVAYRAFVRAKVAALRVSQGDVSSTTEAGAYAELALRHLRAGRPRLVLVGGLPGTGKSTLAGGIACRMNAVVLASDRVRKELAGLGPYESGANGYQRGIYSEDHSARTYRELLDRAAVLLALGETVVLDASWLRAADREAAARVAQRTNTPLTQLRCVVPSDVAAERICRRRGDTSDADPSIAKSMAADEEHWSQATDIPTMDRNVALEQALVLVGGV